MDRDHVCVTSINYCFCVKKKIIIIKNNNNKKKKRNKHTCIMLSV